MSWRPNYVREDGTFCIIVKFKTTANAANVRDKAAEWCKEWVAENKSWNPASPSDDSSIVDKGAWSYYAIFSGPPDIVRADNDQLWLRFRGVYSYWWRDWAARIVGGLMHALPELRDQYLSFDCDE
jgi:hypothetical protein